ncbi:MFS transporter [Candidatus Gracilibacteria bacterium]|nr:MFS transporter [Candidatus Gracilibacteria bacterium]
MDNIKSSIKFYYVVQFLSACIFTTAIWSFFLTSFNTFSFSIATFLIILSGIISFLFEAPSGYLADKYGRKKVYLLGTIFILISFLLWIFSKDIYVFIISSILNGIGFAITSGNLEAIIHDNLVLNGKEEDFKDIQSNGYTYLFFGRAFSSFFAGYLFVINPFYPVYASIFSYLIIIFFLFFINDKGQEKEKNNNMKEHIFSGLKYIYNDKIILNIILILVFVSSFGNIFWFTYQPYFKQIGFSIENIGILFSITGLLSGFGAFLIKKLQDKYQSKYILLLIVLLLFLSSLLFLSFNYYLGILGLIMISIMFGFIMSFGNTVLLKKSPKNLKSTILSLFSLFMTLGYSLFSLCSGIIYDFLGLNFLYLLNLIFVICLFFYSFLNLNN